MPSLCAHADMHLYSTCPASSTLHRRRSPAGGAGVRRAVPVYPCTHTSLYPACSSPHRRSPPAGGAGGLPPLYVPPSPPAPLLIAGPPLPVVLVITVRRAAPVFTCIHTSIYPACSTPHRRSPPAGGAGVCRPSMSMLLYSYISAFPPAPLPIAGPPLPVGYIHGPRPSRGRCFFSEFC